MLFSVLHNGSCDYSCFWSYPSSSCSKASPILVPQVLQVLQVVVGAPGTLAGHSRMHRRQ